MFKVNPEITDKKVNPECKEALVQKVLLAHLVPLDAMDQLVTVVKRVNQAHQDQKVHKVQLATPVPQWMRSIWRVSFLVFYLASNTSSEYKEILRQLIYDEVDEVVRFGADSDLLNTVSEMLRSQYPIVCSKSSTCRTEKHFSYGRQTVQPICAAPIAAPYSQFRSRQRAAEPEFRRASMDFPGKWKVFNLDLKRASLATCVCRNPAPQPTWAPQATPYKPITIRRPDPQVVTNIDNDKPAYPYDSGSDSESEWSDFSFTKRTAPKITKRPKNRS